MIQIFSALYTTEGCYSIVQRGGAVHLVETVSVFSDLSCVETKRRIIQGMNSLYTSFSSSHHTYIYKNVILYIR